jgi:UDP:flavonoid glycosyltransferase YjiC (YdhE family)
MSKFLFTLLPSNDLGVVTRALPIATSLRSNGHKIVFSVHSKVPSKLISEERFVNIPLRTYLDNLAIKIRKNGGLVKFIRYTGLRESYSVIRKCIINNFKLLPKKFITSTPDVHNMEHFFILNGMINKNYIIFMVESLMQVMKETEVDFVVDFWNPYAVIAAKALNIPVITINQFDVHPSANGFIWWKNISPKFKSVLPILNKILANYNLSKISKIEELTIGDLTLTLGMPNKNEINPDTGINHIGFLVYKKKGMILPKNIVKLGKDKPVVWVYSGNPRYAGIKTDFDSEILLDLCINTLAKENINIVLTTGYHSIPKKYLPLPKNILFFDFVDGLLMAEKADVVIHHGGYGSCQTALITGTPSLIIPTFSERESNARRIAKLGVGEYVLPTKKKFLKRKIINKNEFIEKFNRVLKDDSYKRNSQKISEELSIFNAENKGLKLIEKFVEEYKVKNNYSQAQKIRFIEKYTRNLKLVQ